MKGIGIFIIIVVVIWLFPPTRKLLITFYEENQIVKVVVDIIVSLIQGIGNAIYEVFKVN